MKIRTWRSSLFAALPALAMTVPARADLVTFEDVMPTLFITTISSGGYDFASDGSGFSGVDTAAAFAFPPKNSTGQFLFALNADGITMSDGGALFLLRSFDMSFVQPQLPVDPLTSAGRLTLAAITPGGRM